MSDYLATVERFFVVLRRRGLMLSAADVARVVAWESAGLPIDAVCRGLAAGADQFRALNGDETTLPDTLAYYTSFVDDEVARLQAEPAAATGGVVRSADDLSDALADLAWIGQQQSDPRRLAAYRAAWRSLKTAQSDRATALADADRVAMETFVAALTPSERKKLLLEVAHKLAPEKANLGVRGAAVRHQAILEALVVAQYGLVRLAEDDKR